MASRSYSWRFAIATWKVKGRSNYSEQHGISTRNSRRIAVSDQTDEYAARTCLSSNERFCGACATATSERSASSSIIIATIALRVLSGLLKGEEIA